MLHADITPDSQVKQAAVGFGAFPGEETAQEEVPVTSTNATATQPEDTIPSSDPTIAHAGLTELGLKQPADEEKPIVAAEDLPIAEASIDDGSANKSAETQWDNAGATAGTEEQLDDSFEMVPRPAEESTNSWADQTSANATATEAAAEHNNTTNGLASTDAEGYQSVERRGGRGGQGRGGRGRGRGGPRGGHRGNFRGRGDGQGRGRGGRGGAPQPQA